jgi:hypothetical protein
LVVEDPGEYAYIRHRGWGTELAFALPREDEDPTNLSLRNCHIPIPTPALVDGEVPVLSKIYVLYQTQSEMYIADVVVWDYGQIVCQWNNDLTGPLLAPGSHLELDASNQLFVPDPQPVSTGVGVTLQCQLNVTSVPGDSPGVDPQLEPWILTVTEVGADFVYPSAKLTFHTGYIADKGLIAIPVNGVRKK